MVRQLDSQKLWTSLGLFSLALTLGVCGILWHQNAGKSLTISVQATQPAQAKAGYPVFVAFSVRNKLDPSLLEVVDKAEPNVEINVGIWLTEPGPEWSLPRPDLGFLLTSEDVARLDAERQEHEADAQRQMQTLQAGLLDELSSMGAPIRHASRFAPLVYTTLTRDGILHVAQRADVRYISLEGQGGPE